jgi:hypothetical protein
MPGCLLERDGELRPGADVKLLVGAVQVSLAQRLARLAALCPFLRRNSPSSTSARARSSLQIEPSSTTTDSRKHSRFEAINPYGQLTFEVAKILNRTNRRPLRTL